ncbi:MAG: UDP-N-acetylmuramoyl-tripeptide--D-alanyl-D-alanine ligase [Actinobacteria bacterium]|nr:UDP-N-acetylmuramoyl-tripeptide--D-alanyl-D-alanine ligase [Actinomycetota bacterium]
MIPLALDEIRALCPGTLTAAHGVERVTGVEIDSRQVGPGDLFVAVRGGVAYVDEAFTSGAAAALVPDDAPAALAALGRAVRSRTQARVVAITGSLGKTSTKDILAALCRPLARTVAAPHGYNNEIGLPLTLTRVEPDTEILIVEMGMRGPGQIRALASLARPGLAVITSIGPVHLELLGSVENIARAKAEVLEALPPGGTAVVPARSPELEPYLERRDIDLVRFGAGGDVRLRSFRPPILEAELDDITITLDVSFRQPHQAENMLAALAAYRALGLPLARAAEGAREIAFSRWRGEEHELPGGILVINDAWNANPDSMDAALRNLSERARAGGRRRVAVLGDMAELGERAAAYHRRVGETAVANVDLLVAVGALAQHYLEAPVADSRRAETWEDAVTQLRGLLRPGDVVLVKASRSLGLERVVEALERVPA